MWKHYFQHTEPCPGCSFPSVGTKEESWGRSQALEPLVEDSLV